jgi:hypothetical protein
MEQRHRQQPSESTIRRDPTPTTRVTVPAAATTMPAAEAMGSDERDDFVTALCQRLTLTIEEKLLPRIQARPPNRIVYRVNCKTRSFERTVRSLTVQFWPAGNRVYQVVRFVSDGGTGQRQYTAR